MPFPQFKGKHQHDAYFTPQDYLNYLKQNRTWPDMDTVPNAILIYQTSLMQRILAAEALEPVAFLPGFLPGDCCILKGSNPPIAVAGRFGIGPSAASTVLEELVAAGVRRVVNIGTAGGLQPASQIGHIVLCTKALRDEGVSHHYAKPGKYASPSRPLTDALKRALARRNISYASGPTWTIDAPYRETIEEVKQYQAGGILTVEMEAATVFAIAQYRHVEAAAAFVISDSLANLKWQPQFGTPQVNDSLWRLFQAACDALMAAT